MKKGLHIVVGLLLASLASGALAGSYVQVSQTGGTAHYGNGNRDYLVTNNGSYGGTAQAGGSTQPSCSCDGTITTVFQWSVDYPGEPPPASVVVRESCNARGNAQTYGGTPQADADNGLGGPKSTDAGSIYYPPGKYKAVLSSSTRYRVLGGASILTITCTPTASATAPNGPANATVGYSVAVGAVHAFTGGGLPGDDPSVDNILIGQRATAQLVCDLPDVTFANYSWSVSGVTYAYWNVASDQSTASEVAVPGSVWSQAVPAWRWREMSQASNYTVSGTATVYAGGTSLGSVSGERKVKAWEPYWFYGNETGPVTYSSSRDYVFAGSETGDPAVDHNVAGMTFDGRVGDPAFFNGEGTGIWQFVQLIDIYREGHYPPPATSPPPVASYAYVLDNSMPYGDGVSGLPYARQAATTNPDASGNPTGNRIRTWDYPGNGLAGTVEYLDADTFKMVQMYRPPSNGNGDDNDPDPANRPNDWVSLERFEWGWSAHDSRSDPGNPYDNAHPGSVYPNGYTHRPELPNWNSKFSNTP